MKTCPALYCKEQIPHSHAFCPEHFRALPEEYRNALLSAVRARDFKQMAEATRQAHCWMIREREKKKSLDIELAVKGHNEREIEKAALWWSGDDGK